MGYSNGCVKIRVNAGSDSSIFDEERNVGKEDDMPRWFFLLFGHCCVGLGLLGSLLPLLPTTPFLILAAACYRRGSVRLSIWLEQHPRLGPPLRDWEQGGVIRTRTKRIAVLVVWLGMTYSIYIVPLLAVQILLVCIGIAVTVFIVTRPSETDSDTTA